MDDRFESTFVVEIAPDIAWQRLTENEPTAEGDKEHWLPGFEAVGDELEVEPGHLLRVRKATPPCDGTEIVVTLEQAGKGTRVTVVQSGFGAWFESALEWLTVGWNQIVADLILHLETGVRPQRYTRPWASLGCDVTARPSGLAVGTVHPGGLAERVGLAEGDVLLLVGGAPVFDLADLTTLMRVFHAGDNVEVGWLREGERHRGAAAL
jgi:hypothetical protein